MDVPLADLPDASCFEKIVLKGTRTLEITYSKDRVNAGEVLAAAIGGAEGRARGDGLAVRTQAG